MSLPNIGVGSPITINNVNEIINAINRLSLDVQSLQARVDKAASAAASSGEDTSLYVITQSYGSRTFKITATQAKLPANSVFTGVDIIAIMHDSKNLLNQGYNAKIDGLNGIGTRTINFNVKVTKDSSSTIKVPNSGDPVKWKFDLDYAIPSTGSNPVPGSGGGPGMVFE